MTYDVSFAYVDEEITFNNLSEFATSYEWNFGDGTTSTDVNPSHVYTKEGEFTISLTAIGDGVEVEEQFPITIQKQTVVGDWTLVSATYNGDPITGATGSFSIVDAENYSASFVDGGNKGDVTAKYTSIEASFLTNIDANVAVLNGTSWSGKPTLKLWSTEIFCNKTIFDNYLKFGLGIGKPEISTSGRYMLISGNTGKAILKYQKK